MIRRKTRCINFLYQNIRRLHIQATVLENDVKLTLPVPKRLQPKSIKVIGESSGTSQNDIPLNKETTSFESSKFLAILLGWPEGNKDDLEEYAKMYHSFDIPTIQVIPDLHAFRFPDKHAKLSMSTIDELRLRHNLESRKVIIHMFGGASHIYLPQMAGVAAKKKDLGIGQIYPSLEKVFGFHNNAFCWVFDSCPIYFKSKYGYRVIRMAKAKENIGLRAKFKLIRSKFYTYLAAFLNEELYRNQLDESFKGDLFKRANPQLYLLSKTDNICEFEKGLEFAEDKKQNGFAVSVKSFDSSEHVKLLQTYPDEYRECLEAFLKKSIEQDQAENNNEYTNEFCG